MVWPEAKQILRHHCLDNLAKKGENLYQQFRFAVQSHSVMLNLV
jgi:hypothetical protein